MYKFIRLVTLTAALLILAPAAWAQAPLPLQPQRTDHALFHDTGAAELGFAYTLSGQTGMTLQTGHFLGRYAFSDTIEGRIGWHVFGLHSFDNGGAIRGVGDFYFEGKFRLPLSLPDGHGFAILASARPGIGQAPVNHPGLGLGVHAIYSLPIAMFRLDGQAGAQLTILDSDPRAAIPLSAALNWEVVNSFELVGEIIHSSYIDGFARPASARFLIGARWNARESLTFDIGTGSGIGRGEFNGFLMLGASAALGGSR